MKKEECLFANAEDRYETTYFPRTKATRLSWAYRSLPEVYQGPTRAYRSLPEPTSAYWSLPAPTRGYQRGLPGPTGAYQGLPEPLYGWVAKPKFGRENAYALEARQ